MYILDEDIKYLMGKYKATGTLTIEEQNRVRSALVEISNHVSDSPFDEVVNYGCIVVGAEILIDFVKQYEMKFRN